MSAGKLRMRFALPVQTKLFCNCSTAPFRPNTRCCPTCLGLPGAMPSLNGRAMNLAVEAVRALGCRPVTPCVFYKKTNPGVGNAAGCGALRYALIGDGEYDVIITEEPGHEDYNGMVNLNRRGIPVLEVCAEADGQSAQAKYDEVCALLNGKCDPAGFELDSANVDCGEAAFIDCDLPPVDLQN